MSKKFLAFTLLVSGISIMNAQSADHIKGQLIKDWERAKAYTIEYLNAMPKEKYDLRPDTAIMSFAEQMLHLAQANMGLSANGTGKERIWTGRNLQKIPSASTPDSVRYFVSAAYDFVIDGIRNMDISKLEEKIKIGKHYDETRLAWLMKAFEHQTHHRGQTTIYLRMAGIKPPNEKLF